MARELKGDFHMHTAEDPYDVVVPTAKDVVDRAQRRGYEVLAITNHGTRTYSKELADYAAERGILLIPGAEMEVAVRHVLVLNPTERAMRARTFEELRKAKEEAPGVMAVIAPHPYFPSIASLGRWLADNIDVFDAIEHAAFYFLGLNFNLPAIRQARKFGLPLVGNSDAHYSWQFGGTYSMVEADKTVLGVIDAIRKGRVRVVSKRLPINGITVRMGMRALRIPEYLLWKEWREGDPFWDSPDGR